MHTLRIGSSISWDPEEIKADPSQTVYHQDENGQIFHLRTNQTIQLAGLITYLKHVFESYNSVLIFQMTHSIHLHLLTPDA